MQLLALAGHPEKMPEAQAMKGVFAQIPTITGPLSVRSCLIWLVERLLQKVYEPLPKQILLVSVQMPGVVAGDPEEILPEMQGQLLLNTPPTFARQFIASTRYPPVQLLLRWLGAYRQVHSSEASQDKPQLQPFMRSQDQQVAIEAKAQQQPQLNWFFTDVTYPSVLQSKEAGGDAETVDTSKEGVSECSAIDERSSGFKLKAAE